MSTERPYEGSELDIFAHAVRWKRYWSSKLKPLLGRKVLEVGAGIGTNTPYLCSELQDQWLCLEPDSALTSQIAGKLGRFPWAGVVETRVGIVTDLPEEPVFDSIIYIDVLEHIEDDLREVEAAISRLKPGGKLIVLSPAYQFLFTEFDASIGHYRRYTAGALRRLTPSGAAIENLFYLDCAGLLTSLANKVVLHQPMPKPAQLLFWDKRLVPLSKALDRICGYRLGRSVIAIWTRKD